MDRTEAEELATEMGYDETSDSWGPMVSYAEGLLHDGSDEDDEDDEDE